MLYNFIKIAFRNFFKYKGYSLINIIGLAAGIFTGLLIFLFVQDEMTFDQYHQNADKIGRLEFYYQGQDEEAHWAATPGFLGTAVADRFPEVKSAVKLMFNNTPVAVSYGNDNFSEKEFVFADSSFLDVFNHKVILGDKKTALDAPDKMIITKSTAKRYFGNDDPIGKVLKLTQTSFKVSAVVEDVPKQSHYTFDMVASLDYYRNRAPQFVEGRSASAFYAYVKLNEHTDIDTFQEKLDDQYYEINDASEEDIQRAKDNGIIERILINPLTAIHLNGHAEKEIRANSDVQYVYIFGTIAVFVLLIAAFNYMNLATSRTIKRSKEVGVRKVLGARKAQIFYQFLGESFLFTFISTLIGILLVYLVLPSFNEFTNKELALNSTGLLASIVVFVAVSVLSGIYPSLFVSNFKILPSLKSDLLAGKSNKGVLMLRRSIVVLQFGISIFLIIAAITVYNQLDYIQSKALGFNKEQVAVMALPGRASTGDLTGFKSALMSLPNVTAAAESSTIPGKRVHIMTVRVPEIATRGNVDANGETDNGERGIRIISGDDHLVETFDFEVIAGRDFSKDFPTDSSRGFLLNEAALKAFQLGTPEEAVGKDFEYLYGLPEPKQGKIVGVLKNFHYASIHHEIEPLMIHIYPRYSGYLSVRIGNGNIQETLGQIEEVWNEFVTNVPFDYTFLDSLYDNQYKLEQNMGKIVSYFTAMAIIIASLGLFGLASFITEQRTKEVGVRKVLGASIGSIMYELSFEFVLLVAISNLVAWIPAIYLLTNWLDNFAFRTELNWTVFVGASLLSIFVAISTISFKTYLAAIKNPINSLKFE